VQSDASGAPRLALHAAELGFAHPVTGKPLHWTMELPEDLRTFLHGLRAPAASERVASGGRQPPVKGTNDSRAPTRKRRQRRVDDANQMDRR
jgi:hypothetical protein